MQDWEVYKQAALDYSRLRPRVVVATITLLANQVINTLPTDCLRVRYLAYGDEGEFGEVVLATSGAVTTTGTTSAWASEGNQLAVWPAPTDDTTVQIIYSARHLPDEDGQAFPTLPAADIGYVDDLEHAYLLDIEADQISGGPVSYSVGQTQVDREAAIADLRARALALRTRVQAALDDPLALWS